ncbi:MAG: DUF3833 domain-containing protein [Rhodospirillales bacterium]|nr:DUF3833 domain-containing protein [Rhodospirillales bacterium]
MGWLRALLPFLLMPVILVSGCGTMKPEQFASAQPKFLLEDYFLGRTRAWGIFEDRFGDLRRQFVVDIDGSWQGNTFILHEKFAYSDGETDERTWKIRKTAGNRYEGTAGDVVGTAQGIAAGNALNWRYDLDLKVGNRTWRVHFDDWMFLQPDGILMNRARVTKWGIAVGELTVIFQRWPREGSAQIPRSSVQQAGSKPSVTGG